MLHNAALECYLDGGKISVYTIQFSQKIPTNKEIEDFCENCSAIGLDVNQKISISIRHKLDLNNGFVIVLVAKI